MNRAYLPGRGNLEPGVIELFARMTIGASGAISSIAYQKGIFSIVRTSAGLYTLTLEDSYNALLYGEATLVAAGVHNPTTEGVAGRLSSEAVISTTPTVAVQFYKTSDGTAVDPASGVDVMVRLCLRASSAGQ